MNDTGQHGRVRKPKDTPFPCLALPGGMPDATDIVMAVEQGTPLTELCPYGSLAYRFPKHPEARAIAEAAGPGRFLFLSRILGASDADGRPQESWEPCDNPVAGTRPNLERMGAAGLLDEGYTCPCFEHDCPVYYGVVPGRFS